VLQDPVVGLLKWCKIYLWLMFSNLSFRDVVFVFVIGLQIMHVQMHSLF
jgi:hypothetical protein